MTSRFPSTRKLPAVGVVFYLIASPTLAFPIGSSLFNDNQTVSDGSNNLVGLAAIQTLEAPFPYEFPKEENQMDLFPMPKCNGVTLEEATIDQLQDAMDTGLLTTSQIVLCYMQRIYQTDLYLEYVFCFLFFAWKLILKILQNIRSRLIRKVRLWSSTPTSCR